MSAGESATVASTTPVVVGDQSVRFAGFWLRFLAGIIDLILLSVVAAIIKATGADSVVRFVLLLIIWWLYFALMESSRAQGTLGKLAIGLCVTDDSYRRIGFRRATGRVFAKILSALILGIGFFMVGWTDRSRGLHDMLASTLVLRRQSRWMPKEEERVALVPTGAIGKKEQLRGKWREFSIGEQICAYFIGVGTVLLLISLFGPWFKLDLGRFGVSGLSGGDAKGSVGLALLVIALCVLFRLATPIRPVWIYPPLAVIGIFAFVKTVDSVGAGTSGSGSTIKETGFAQAAYLGSLVIILAGIAATIVYLRQSGLQDRMAGTVSASKSKVPDPALGSQSATSVSVPGELERLVELHKTGALSDEEFARAKARLLE